MKVLVMGAGVAGVTAAYQLLKDGHEVVVVDRQPEAANETSFANAGLVAPGHSFAWASPKVPKILLRSLWIIFCQLHETICLRAMPSPKISPRMLKLATTIHDSHIY